MYLHFHFSVLGFKLSKLVVLAITDRARLMYLTARSMGVPFLLALFITADFITDVCVCVCV